MRQQYLSEIFKIYTIRNNVDTVVGKWRLSWLYFYVNEFNKLIFIYIELSDDNKQQTVFYVSAKWNLINIILIQNALILFV